MALAKLVSKQKGRRFLKRLIEEELTERRSIAPITKESWLRASSMYRYCAREEVLSALLDITREDEIGIDLMMIFEHGHALHSRLQDHILPRLGVLYGQWRCLWCQHMVGGLKPGVPLEATLVAKPKRCKCGKEEFAYNELHFENPKHRINGHPDGFLKIPGLRGLGLLEVKSIGFRGGIAIRDVPNVSHVIQSQTYMFLTGLKWAKILYWQKQESGLNALVEHLVEYDQETVDTIRETADSIFRGLRTGALPERICVTSTCSKAKKCPLKGPCFENEDRLGKE